MKMDQETQEFLDALDLSTASLYKVGLETFTTFYGKSPKDFLDAVEADRQKLRRKRSRIARNTLKAFADWMEKKKLAGKTIRAYIASVQSLASYYEITISTRFVNLPPAIPVSKKFPWTLSTVVKFIGMIRHPEIKSIGVTIFQSGLSIADILRLRYGDIQYEFEHNTIPLCFDLARHKTDIPHMTFTGRWGVDLLKEQLETRKLKFKTPLFSISHRTIDDYFQKLGQKFVGEYEGQNPTRPHSLRAGFRTLLGDAGMDRDVVKFFMGQRLPEQDRVYHSRSREGWRRCYKKYMHVLEPREQ